MKHANAEFLHQWYDAFTMELHELTEWRFYSVIFLSASVILNGLQLLVILSLLGLSGCANVGVSGSFSPELYRKPPKTINTTVPSLGNHAEITFNQKF